MTAMRGELKEELSGVRQEVAVLAKTIEANQQAMMLRFEQADKRHDDLLAAMNQRFEQADQRHNDLLRTLDQRFDQVNDRFGDMKADMLGIRADMRQTRTWLVALYGLVVFGFLGTMMITIFKDTLFK